MSYNIVLRSPVTARPYEDEVFSLPIAGVPYTLGAMRLRMSPYWYTSPEDYARGRSLLAELGSGLLMPSGQDIVNAVDRVTVLLDGAFNGIARVGTEIDPIRRVWSYDPALSHSADPTNFHDPSLRFDTKATRWLYENFVNGTTSDFAPGEAITNAKLEAIRLLLEAMGTDDGPTFEQVAQVIAILGA